MAKDWDMIRLVNFVMMIPLLLSLFLVPESPKYHVAKSEPEKALKYVPWSYKIWYFYLNDCISQVKDKCSES